MNDRNRLYGFPGDEQLQFDPADVYEQWADDHDYPACLTYERDPDIPEAVVNRPDRLVIEEWSAAPAALDVMTADQILAHISECFADDAMFEDASEAVDNACGHEDVIAAFEAARDLLVAKASPGWMIAQTHLRDLIVTWDDNGEPLLDGEPMYRPTEQP